MLQRPKLNPEKLLRRNTLLPSPHEGGKLKKMQGTVYQYLFLPKLDNNIGIVADPRSYIILIDIKDKMDKQTKLLI